MTDQDFKICLYPVTIMVNECMSLIDLNLIPFKFDSLFQTAVHNEKKILSM